MQYAPAHGGPGLCACSFCAAVLPAADRSVRRGRRARQAEPVRIEGYADEAMEPFLSRDGRFLFFNTRNDPGANTNIHFAEASGPEAKDSEFIYRGILGGTVSYALDGTPTMSADGRFCFVSPRDYRRALITVYCGTFDGERVERRPAPKHVAGGTTGAPDLRRRTGEPTVRP